MLLTIFEDIIVKVGLISPALSNHHFIVFITHPHGLFIDVAYRVMKENP